VKEGDGNVATFTMKQRFGFPGMFNIFVFIMNDSYMGLDQEIELKFKIEDFDKDRVIEEVHKEDVDAVKGPGMVQSMLDMKRDDDDDDDDESSDDNAATLITKLKKAGLDSAVPAKKDAPKKVAEDNQLLK